MKSLARNYAWWPNLDTDMERCVRHCAPCESTRSTRAKTLLHPWEWPTKPWHRVQLDYAGPINSQMVLIITDAHSRWIDAYATHGTTSAGTIEKLRRFATHGLHRVIVGDNGACFLSSEFAKFTRRNDIRHKFLCLQHQASNGLAEYSVGVKSGLHKLQDGNLETRLSCLLFKYRTTPHCTTGVIPS